MKKIIILLVVVFAFTACDMGNSYSGYHEFSDLLWQKSDKPSFDFEIKKEANYSLDIELRIVYGYTYRDIKMDMKMSKDGSNEKLIPIYFKVRNEDDSYKGDMMGDIIDIQEQIISDTILPAGKYSFELDQLVDSKTLPFVMEVGLVVKDLDKK